MDAKQAEHGHSIPLLLTCVSLPHPSSSLSSPTSCPPLHTSTYLNQHIIRLHTLEHHIQHLCQGCLGGGLVGLAVAHEEDVVAGAHRHEQCLGEVAAMAS
eukprot:1157780-Pelagomonas_calceolata.AAC.16